MSPELNAESLIHKINDTHISINIGYMSQVGCLICDTVIDSLNEYSKSLLDLHSQDEAQALILEERLKFWLETKKILSI